MKFPELEKFVRWHHGQIKSGNSPLPIYMGTEDGSSCMITHYEVSMFQLLVIGVIIIPEEDASFIEYRIAAVNDFIDEIRQLSVDSHLGLFGNAN